MKLSKITIFILITFLPIVSHADVYINEIMYDLPDSDTGREWVEVYNNGASAINISGWKFQETATASNHALTTIVGTSTIPANGFAIIMLDSAKFLVDWPSFSGNLLKASFSSLNNTGSTLVLKDNTATVIDQVIYTSSQGANGDGNSLQKSTSSWISASPTPGLTNSTQAVTSASTTDTTSTATATTTETTNNSSSSSVSNNTEILSYSSPVYLSNIPEKMEFEVSAGRPRLTSVGNSVVFKANITRIQNISERNISHTWSFGDGTVAQGEIVTHIYKFAGDYTVVLNSSYSDKQAVDSTSVIVVLPSLAISRLDGGFEVYNKSGNEINLEGWRLVGGTKEFVFPRDTLIGKNKKIVFADEVTGVSDTSASLSNPMGKVFAKIEGIPDIFMMENSSLQEISMKLEVAKQELAQMTVSSDKTVNSIPVPAPTSLAIEKTVVTPIKNEINSEATSTQVANVVQIFEDVEQHGMVSTLFSWPIKGFNFIYNLFKN